MKKLLFSILIILGLFLIGCGKDNKDDGKENTLSVEDKSRPKLEWQDTSFEGKPVKEIVIIPAEKEEQDKLFEKALKSKEDFAKNFPYLSDEDVEQAFTELSSIDREKNFEYFDYGKEVINLENTYQEFVKNDKFLREYITENEIKELYDTLQHKKLGQADFKIQKFNDYFIKSKILKK